MLEGKSAFISDGAEPATFYFFYAHSSNCKIYWCNEKDNIIEFLKRRFPELNKVVALLSKVSFNIQHCL